MSEANKDNNNSGEEENYEAAKLSFEVMETYELPGWFKNHVWLWPMVVSYLYLIYLCAPQNRMFTIVSYGLLIIFMDLVSIWIRRCWPM